MVFWCARPWCAGHGHPAAVCRGEFNPEAVLEGRPWVLTRNEAAWLKSFLSR